MLIKYIPEDTKTCCSLRHLISCVTFTVIYGGTDLSQTDGLAGDNLQYCHQFLSFLKSWLHCKSVIHTLASGGLPPIRFLFSDCSSRKLPMQSTAPGLPYKEIRFLFFKYRPYGL